MNQSRLSRPPSTAAAAPNRAAHLTAEVFRPAVHRVQPIGPIAQVNRSSSNSTIMLTADASSAAREIVHGCAASRSEEHTSELQSLMRISYAVFCLKKKKNTYIECQKQQ